MLKFYCIFLFCIYFNVGSCVKKKRIETIVNRVHITDYPYNAFVYAYNVLNEPINKPGCSGAIISEYLILTAANCLYYPDQTKGSLWISKLLYNLSSLYRSIYKSMYGYIPADVYTGGDWYYEKIPVNQLKVYIGTDQPLRSHPFNVKKVHLHPDYYYGRVCYDFAYLQLENEMLFTRVNQPIPIITNEEYYAVNMSGLLTGYGATGWDDTMQYRWLHSVRATIAPPESCNLKNYNDYNTAYPDQRPIFCAKVHEKDNGMCKAWHTGSPFTVGKGSSRRLVGIASTAHICPYDGPAIISSIQGIGSWDIDV